MKSFKEQYQDALALEEKYRSAPRSGWVEKGSRKKANQAICVGRMEAEELARDLSSALYGENHIMKELITLEQFLDVYAQNQKGSLTCEKCFRSYLPDWLNGTCPYCAAAEEATEDMRETLGNSPDPEMKNEYLANKENCRFKKPKAQAIRKTLQVLADNGIPADETETVLQAIGYTLLDMELFQEE